MTLDALGIETDLSFVAGARPDDDLRLLGVEGREQISKPFAFELLLVRPVGPLDDAELDELLATPSAIGMGPGPADVVHGMLESIEEVADAGGDHAVYRARLVPSMALLGKGRASRIHQETTIPALVAGMLKSYGLALGTDYELRLGRSYAEREYVVQYEESDLDFLARWLEREGIFYWFEHQAENELLVFGDANEAATPLAGPSVRYRDRNNLGAGEGVWGLSRIRRRPPAHVVLREYNYRAPNVPLAVKEPVAGGGFGTVRVYGEHFKTPAEGAAVARLRAELWACDRTSCEGETAMASLRPGHAFELAGSPDGRHDGRYLVTGVRMAAGRALDLGTSGRASARYHARFTAIPFGSPYRPPLDTPSPRIHGVLHAHVDSETDGEVAAIDEHGRYKVRLPFERGGAPGRASRWIRMAQPSSGAGYGMHFPLHRGAEVLVAHVGGDPDRPVIVGSVPHAHTPSPATRANATQSVIQTASGIRIEFEDQQT